jgi:peptidoglycan/xylan/chitin deacetylase (PgdA/CDA1 family)
MMPVRRFLLLLGALTLVTGAMFPAAAPVAARASDDHANHHSKRHRRDTKPPSFRWRGISPEPLLRDGAVHLLYRGEDESRRLTVSYTITDSQGDTVGHADGISRPRGRGSVSWRAQYGGGAPVLPGLYRATITLTDRSGNSTTGPPRPFRVLRRVRTRVFRRVEDAGRRVALTFDDCNDGRAWARMLRVLAARHVTAAFFCLGIRVNQYPQLARRTVARGNTIGSHGWDHKDFATLSYSAARSRLVKDERAWWSKARNTPAPYFRPPYGSYDATTLRAAGSAGYARTVLWDVDPSDYLRPGASVIAHRVVSAARPGSIVIMHNQLQTAQALPAIIKGLRHHHLMPVSLSALFRAGGFR